jgi:hypothetical protein
MTDLESSSINFTAVHQQRLQAVIDCGFTERQARFLVLVMRHSGVCVPRQYASIAGIANGGRRCNAFFDKLLRRGVAREIPCVHNRARLYHVHHKPLYFVIGEVSSRYRRTVSARLVVERLMLLDAVLALPDVEWLTTAPEKAALLERLRADASLAAPAPSIPVTSDTVPQISSRFPIGVESGSRVVLLFLATEPDIGGFRAFLQAHAALLRAAPQWTLRFAFPRPLDRASSIYEALIHEELESPLHSATISELKWYFKHRRIAAGEAVHPTTRQALDAGAKVFGTPRFRAMYQRWLRHGNAVFEGPSSPAIAEALGTGRGRVESVVLPHAYRHLFPLVTETPARPVPIDEGLRRGNKEGDQREARPQRAPSTPAESARLSIREQQERDWRRLVEAHNAQKAQEFRP